MIQDTSVQSVQIGHIGIFCSILSEVLMKTQITKSAKSEQTRTRIMDTYISLIPQKKWDKITVKELCLHADITRGTFYQYFTDIYEMMDEIENSLLQELQKAYDACRPHRDTTLTVEELFDKVQGESPELFVCWFHFCEKHKDYMSALLHENSDSYFITRLKNMIREHISLMMDADRLPKDELRPHFEKIFTELHIMTASSWLQDKHSQGLSVEEILMTLQTMRLGANYQHWKIEQH